MAARIASRKLLHASSLSSARLVCLKSFAASTPSVRIATRGFSSSHQLEAKRYTNSHEWIELSEDGKTGTVGISAYAAKSLGDVVFVELPDGELELKAGDTFGSVESTKSASEIYTPVGGIVVAANRMLEDKPSVINEDPEGEGWIAKIQLSEGEAEALESLLDAEAYKKHLKEDE